jgi:hypothetical protein
MTDNLNKKEQDLINYFEKNNINPQDGLKIMLRSVLYIFMISRTKPEKFNEAIDTLKKDYLRNYNKVFLQNE